MNRFEIIYAVEEMCRKLVHSLASGDYIIGNPLKKIVILQKMELVDDKLIKHTFEITHKSEVIGSKSEELKQDD